MRKFIGAFIIMLVVAFMAGGIQVTAEAKPLHKHPSATKGKVVSKQPAVTLHKHPYVSLSKRHESCLHSATKGKVVSKQPAASLYKRALAR